MEKEYIITVRNTYLVTADVGEDHSTPSKKNYNEYIEFKIANVLITIFFPIRLFIELFIFLDKKFPRLLEYPKKLLKYIDSIMNFIYPLAMYGLCAIYAIFFFIGMLFVNPHISLLFSLISCFLTLFLLRTFKWYNSKNTILLSMLFGGIIFLIISAIRPYVLLPGWAKFICYANLGNTITYICLFATGADLLINQFYKKNQH